MGADHVIDHYQQDISAEVRKITGKRGVDVVIEHVGTATWQKSVESLAPAGRLVTCGATTGFDAKLDLRFLFSRQLSLLGSFMGTMGELHRVLQFVFRGQLKPVIDRVYPLAEIRAAHERLEARSSLARWWCAVGARDQIHMQFLRRRAGGWTLILLSLLRACARS